MNPMKWRKIFKTDGRLLLSESRNIKGMSLLNKEKERPEEKRERLRQEELKRNPAGSVHGGGLQDLVGGLGWKGTGILILLLLIASVLYFAFFD